VHSENPSTSSPAASRRNRDRGGGEQTTTQAHSGPEPVADALPRLAGNRNFRLVWFGEGISILGSMTTTLVFPLLAVTEFDAGARDMGFLAAATWLPWLLISLPAGVWIDRGDARRIMIRADLWSAAVTASVPVAWAFGHLTLAHVFAAALGVGFGSVFFRTAYASLVPQVVAKDDLEQANSRLVGTESAMQIAGPGVGGALVALVGAAYTVVLDSISFLVSAMCLARMRPGAMSRPTLPAREPMLTSIRAGLRVLARDPYVGISRCRAVCPTSRSRAMAPS